MKNVAVLHHAGSISRIQRSVEFARQHDAIILFSLRHIDVDIARRCGIAVVVCGEAVDTVGEAVLALDEIRKNKITDLYIST